MGKKLVNFYQNSNYFLLIFRTVFFKEIENTLIFTVKYCLFTVSRGAAEVDDGQHFKITAKPVDPAKASWPTISIDELMQVSQQ